MASIIRIDRRFFQACRRHGIRMSRWMLVVNIQLQRMDLYECSEWISIKRGKIVDALCMHACLSESKFNPILSHKKRFTVSTSRFGIGQKSGSNKTPLGLHRVAKKVGAGYPVGTVFSSRKSAGYTWQGLPDAAIAHRILWLEGLEPGYNKGGTVDTFSRYIYIHGVGDETTLGRPSSRGCIHMASADIMPLFQLIAAGTLVWISA